MKTINEIIELEINFNIEKCTFKELNQARNNLFRKTVMLNDEMNKRKTIQKQK